MKDFLIGIIMGIANIIPGVSGGTIAVSFNIYDKIINLISRFRTKIKQEFKFILFIGLGMVFGILAFSKVIKFLLENYPILTNFFFLGVIIGSIPLIYKKTTQKEKNIKYLIPFVIFFAFMIFCAYIMPQNKQANTSVSLMLILQMLIYGVIASACMIIPGVSGSFMLILIGGYETVINAVSSLNFVLLVPMAIGCVLGIFGSAKIINRLIYKYEGYTYAGILGLIVGSVFSVYPGYSFSQNGILPFVTLIIGFIITYGFSLKQK